MPNATLRTTRNANARGYTLLEMTLVIAVSGMIMASAAGAWRIYVKNQAQQETENNISDVAEALDAYLVRIGRFPCPARSDAKRTDTDYGMEGECAETKPGYDGIAAGNCANGICVEQNPASVDPRPRPAGLAVGNAWPPKVRRGMLPFRILNLPEQKAFDGYHARLGYAVTEILTATATYNDGYGGLQILNGQGTALFDLSKSGARYVVFSAGPDRKGVYGTGGQQVAPCDSAAADGENCNTTADSKPTYRQSGQIAVNDATHFDDTIKFYSTNNAPLWKTAGDQEKNLTDMINAQDSQSGVFAIGSQPNNYTLEVAEKVRANGDLKSTKLCDNTGLSKNPAQYGDNCFSPEKITIGGQANFMKCQNAEQAGKYVNQIDAGTHEGAVTCTNTVPNAVVCPTGKFVSGVDADGNVVCQSAYLVCPAKAASICDDPDPVWREAYTIPASDSGDPHILINPFGLTGTYYYHKAADKSPGLAGDFTMTDLYRCTNGQWEFEDDNGVGGSIPANALGITAAPDGICKGCEAVDETITETTPIDCNEFLNSGNDYSYSGTVTTYRRVRTCPDNVETNTIISGACTCVIYPPPDQPLQNCSTLFGPGYTGTFAPSTMGWTCTPAPPHFVSYPSIGSCHCVPSAPTTQTAVCDGGLTGVKTRTVQQICDMAEANFQFPDGHPDTTTSAWNTSGCGCDIGQVDGPYQDACPTGYTGAKWRFRTNLSCTGSTPNWTDWQYNDQCSATCTPVVQQQTIGCQILKGVGWVGNVRQQKTFHCDTTPPDWDADWANVDNPDTVCQPGAHSWVAGGTPDSGHANNPGYPMAGDACTPGAAGYCEKLQGGGFTIYPSCVCN